MSDSGPADDLRLARKVWWLIIAGTVLLPWLVGLCTKIYLDSQGSPTYPWSYFLNPLSLPLLIIMSLWWGLPMVVIAFFARTVLSGPGDYFSRQETLLIIAFTVVVGFAGMVKVFLPIFRNYDPIYVIVPLFFYYFHWILLGLILGLVVAYPMAIWRRHTNK
jgi:hypothetical protein